MRHAVILPPCMRYLYCTLTSFLCPLSFFNEQRFIINEDFISGGVVKYDRLGAMARELR